MIWVDFTLLGIILVSSVISLFRGFVREAFSLMAWMVAMWVGWTFRLPMAELLVNVVSVPSIRLLLAFCILVVMTLLVGALVNSMVVKLVQKTGLSGMDRLLGLGFGLARGVVMVSALVIMGKNTVAVQDPWWQQSQLIPHFEAVAGELTMWYQRW